MHFDGTLTQGGWGGGEGIESGQEKKSSKRRAEGGLPWTKKAKTCAVVAMFTESLAFGSFLLRVASGLGNLASAVVAGGWLPIAMLGVQRWSCALVVLVVALSEKCCLKCCLVTALQSI